MRSFFFVLGEGGGSSDLEDLVFGSVVCFFCSQDHGGFACDLGIVVPDRFVLSWIFLLLHVRVDGLFFFPVVGSSQHDAALVVVEVHA